MDERLMDMVEAALAERFGLAQTAMQEELQRDTVKSLADLSQEIENHPGVSSDAKELIQQFLIADFQNNAHFERYLYIQGAKDCVAVLRELGVIK